MKVSSSAAAALTVVLAASASTGASAFAPAGRGGGRASAGTALNLLPAQGAQLAAASSAAFARANASVASAETTTMAKLSDAAIVNAAEAPLIEVSFETPTEAAAARGLVARLFSLPSIVRGSAGAAAAVGHPEMMADFPSLSFERDGSKEGDDVVLYPIVGFRWVKDGNGNSHVLPPMESRAACPLPKSDKEEEVHGWFSKACKLGSPHGPDEEYCSSPKP